MDKYLFSTGAIREVEKRLFDINDMERMIDAPDINQGFKIFNELSYADELLDMQSPEQFKEVLAHDLGQVRDFLLSISPDDRVSRLILAWYDFHNLKVIFKAKFEGKEKVADTSSLGTIEPEKLIEIIIKGNSKLVLPDEYNSLVKEAGTVLEKKHAPREIDSYLDKKYFTFIFSLVRVLGDPDLRELVRRQIDIANIKMLARSKLLKRSSEEVKESFLPSGNINEQSAIESYNKEMANIIKAIENIFTDSEIIKELNNFLETNEIWRLDLALDNYLVRLIKDAKARNEGPTVIYAYFLAKKNAIKNIQIIMTGHANEIEASEIKERVRELY